MLKDVKQIYLCKPGGQKICVLNGVQTSSVDYKQNLKDYNELTFTVDRFINIDNSDDFELTDDVVLSDESGNITADENNNAIVVKKKENKNIIGQIESNGYNNLKSFMELYIDGLDRFQIQEPEVDSDGDKEIKIITAYSLEKELEDKDLVGFKVNKCTSDSIEMLVSSNVTEINTPKAFAKVYSKVNKSLSVLDRILEKCPSWSVGHVDEIFVEKVCPSFEEDNTNIYAFLTSTLAPRIKAVVTFDTINKKINLYDVETYGEDSNVFIGFRNLANSIKVSVDEDSISTKFNVRGDDDLQILDVNFGDSSIINLDYYMTDCHMSYPLIAKLNKWKKYKNDNRKSYINLSKQWSDLNEKINNVRYRVPNDGTDYTQWDNMNEEALTKSLEAYKKTLELLQQSVDPNENGNPRYADNGDGTYTYSSWLKSDGTVDHNKYLDLLYKMENGYGGYYTYLEINKYIIPNIEIAIENLSLVEDDKKDYIKEFETNWDLYGIEELKGKLDLYEKEIVKGSLTNYAKSWANLTVEEKAKYSNDEANYGIYHDKYVEYSGYIGSEITVGSLKYKLKQLNDELTYLQSKLSNINKSRSDMANNAKLQVGNFGLTDEDMNIVSVLLHETDYQNSNIFTTSIDTTLTKIDVEEALYQDSVDKLYEVSQPQFKFSADSDNLLNIEEFKGWKNGFKFGNFFRLGVRDDYSVKVRIVSLSYNPCEITEDLNIGFSSMILSRSGRNDFTSLIGENNRGSKNSISIGSNSSGSGGADSELLNQILTALITSNMFKKAIGNTVNNLTVDGVLNVDEAQVRALIAKYAKIDTINVEKITGDQASFNKLFSTYLNAEVIVGDSAVFKKLDAAVANISKAIIGTSSIETGIIFNLNSQNAVLDETFVKNEIAQKITVGDLIAGDITLTDKMRVLSENGLMIMNGETLQIMGTKADGTKYVAIQLGYDANKNPSLVICDGNGAVMLDAQGLHESIVPDGFIRTDMVGDKQITEDKIDKTNIREWTDDNGDKIFDVSQLYYGNDKFSVSYSTLQQSVKDLGNMADTIELTGEQVFKKVNSVITPKFIVVNAICRNNAKVTHWYVDGVENTTYISSDKSYITIPNSYMEGKNIVTIKATNDNGNIYDICSLYLLEDGKDGDSTYSVITTYSNGVMFNENSVPSNTVGTCKVYHGVDEITPNSYNWMCSTDNGATWKSIGTTKQVTIPLSKDMALKQIYCEVDV